jgi:hypothetical protein
VTVSDRCCRGCRSGTETSGALLRIRCNGWLIRSTTLNQRVSWLLSFVGILVSCPLFLKLGSGTVLIHFWAWRLFECELWFIEFFFLISSVLGLWWTSCGSGSLSCSIWLQLRDTEDPELSTSEPWQACFGNYFHCASLLLTVFHSFHYYSLFFIVTHCFHSFHYYSLFFTVTHCFHSFHYYSLFFTVFIFTLLHYC